MVTYRRRYGFALGAVLVGAVLLVPVPALADNPLVTFSGGCGVLGVGASSQPSRSAIQVVPESSVDFVNDLGQAATLLVDGRDATTLRAGEVVTVVFHRGPVEIKMTPSCLLASSASPVTVAVEQGPASGTPRLTPASSPSAPASSPPPVRPSRPPKAVHPSSGTHSAHRHARPTPVASTLAAVPASSGSRAAGGVPAARSTGGTPLAGDPAAVAVPGMTSAPPVRHGVSAVLLLVAAICVVGSTTAAIRAIFAERAIRIIRA